MLSTRPAAMQTPPPGAMVDDVTRHVFLFLSSAAQQSSSMSLFNPTQKIADGVSGNCDTCNGKRFIACTWCGGDRRSMMSRFGSELVKLKCTACNELGLMKCMQCDDPDVSTDC
eukprot:m.28594 g.28594  ORF g.28594 m.28594 type:complete len:114 (-) comp8875_c0_seq2:123-464(-)